MFPTVPSTDIVPKLEIPPTGMKPTSPAIKTVQVPRESSEENECSIYPLTVQVTHLHQTEL